MCCLCAFSASSRGYTQVPVCSLWDGFIGQVWGTRTVQPSITQSSSHFDSPAYCFHYLSSKTSWWNSCLNLIKQQHYINKSLCFGRWTGYSSKAFLPKLAFLPLDLSLLQLPLQFSWLICSHWQTCTVGRTSFHFSDKHYKKIIIFISINNCMLIELWFLKIG